MKKKQIKGNIFIFFINASHKKNVIYVNVTDNEFFICFKGRC